MISKNKLCCEDMEYSLNDLQVPLKYDPIFREYYMPLIKSSSKDLIYFCPWCAAELPKGLRDEWLNIIENEYNLDPFVIAIEKSKEFPEEFKSDQWWKKRNL